LKIIKTVMVKKCKILFFFILSIVLNTFSGFAQTIANDSVITSTIQENLKNKQQKSTNQNNPTKLNSSETNKSQVEVKDVNINIIDTYERTLDKGFKSIEMLKKVGDAKYFEGNLTESAKWYSQLFDLTTDLENQYYFRFSRSLTAISQFKKAEEMMKIYDERSVLK